MRWAEGGQEGSRRTDSFTHSFMYSFIPPINTYWIRAAVDLRELKIQSGSKTRNQVNCNRILAKQQLYWICLQYRGSVDESLVYSAEAGVKGTWSGQALRRSYLTWDLKEDGTIWLGSQRRLAFQAKDTEHATAPNHKTVLCDREFQLVHYC